MQHFKKIATLLIALIMTMCLASTALAAGHIDLGRNAIIVNNPTVGATYNLYKMLDLSANTANSAYTYTVNTAWTDFFKAAEGETPAGKGLSYVNKDTQGYITPVNDIESKLADFASDAADFVTEKSLTALNSAKHNGIAKAIMFGNIEPGYYLLTSSIGTKAILVTTPANKEVEVEEKNSVPTSDKEVQEDSNSTWGEKNTADIGQTVDFRSTINAKSGALNYVFHDKMSAGLTLDETSIKVTAGTTKLTADTDYTVKTANLTDGCTFEVEFAKTYLKTITDNTTITVSYSATLNENAVVAGKGNPNESWLTYGSNGSSSTTHAETMTYTYAVEILKHASESENTVLSGAEFVILNKDKTKVATVVNGKITGWSDIPTDSTTWPENTVLTTDTNGKIEVAGLDEDTYYLREVKAPAGYNKLSTDQEFKTPTKTEIGNEIEYNTTVVKVANSSGTKLPSTGGIGTTVFYVLGSILAIGAAVLLITRRRMNTR